MGINIIGEHIVNPYLINTLKEYGFYRIDRPRGKVDMYLGIDIVRDK